MKIRDMVLAYNESAKRTEELGRQVGNFIVDALMDILPGIYYELGGDKYGIETLYFSVSVGRPGSRKYPDYIPIKENEQLLNTVIKRALGLYGACSSIYLYSDCAVDEQTAKKITQALQRYEGKI